MPSARSRRRFWPPERSRTFCRSCPREVDQLDHLVDVARGRVVARVAGDRLPDGQVGLDRDVLQHQADPLAQRRGRRPGRPGPARAPRPGRRPGRGSPRGSPAWSSCRRRSGRAGRRRGMRGEAFRGDTERRCDTARPFPDLPMRGEPPNAVRAAEGNAEGGSGRYRSQPRIFTGSQQGFTYDGSESGSAPGIPLPPDGAAGIRVALPPWRTPACAQGHGRALSRHFLDFTDVAHASPARRGSTCRADVRRAVVHGIHGVDSRIGDPFREGPRYQYMSHSIFRKH